MPTDGSSSHTLGGLGAMVFQYFRGGSHQTSTIDGNQQAPPSTYFQHTLRRAGVRQEATSLARTEGGTRCWDDPAFMYNALMLGSIVSLLPTAHNHAIFRSTGTTGEAIIDQVVGNGHIPISIQPPPPPRALHCHHQTNGIVPSPSSAFPCAPSALVRLPLGSSVTVSLTALHFSTFEASVPINKLIPNCSSRNVDELIVSSVLSVADFGRLLRQIDPRSITLPDRLNTRSSDTIVPSGFCVGLSRTNFICLSPLLNVTLIKDNFLSHCFSMSHVDLSPLSRVTAIESNFMLGCRGLLKVDLKPLAGVVTIGNSFLAECTKLTELDFSPLVNLKEVGHRFASKCSQLQSVQLFHSINFLVVNDEFLRHCTSLRSLDLTPLSHVDSIGGLFLANCTSLRFDKTPLSNVGSIGPSFAENCEGRPV